MIELRHKLPTGETMTLGEDQSGTGYEIAIWRENGDRCWSKFFMVKEKASAEYDQWMKRFDIRKE